jgi:hypothetical protein
MRHARLHRWLTAIALASTVVACRKARPTYEYESPVTKTWTGTGPGAAGSGPPTTIEAPPPPAETPPTATTVPTLPAIVAPPTTTPTAPTPTSTTLKHRGWVRPSDPAMNQP